MKKLCQITEENIIDYIDNQLNINLNQEIKVHINNCPKCAKIYNGLKNSMAYIEYEKQQTPSVNVYGQILQRINTTAQANNTKVSHVIVRYFRPAMVAAGLGIGVLLGINLFNNSNIIFQQQNVQRSDAYYVNDMNLEGLEFALMKQ